ncbi:MAG: hypothetical protein WD824_19560 [Cyclobacteriaceae bacterium]
MLRTGFFFREGAPLLEYIPLCNYGPVSAYGHGTQVKAHHLKITDPEGREIPLYPAGSRLKPWHPEGSCYTTRMGPQTTEAF